MTAATDVFNASAIEAQREKITIDRDALDSLRAQLAAAIMERDEARAQAETVSRACAASGAAIAAERDRAREGWEQSAELGVIREVELIRLRAALKPTDENIEAYYDVGLQISGSHWDDVKAILAAIRAKAGLP